MTGAAQASSDERRAWIARHLDPLDDPPPAAVLDADLDMRAQAAAADGQAYTPAAVLIGLIEREAGLSVLLTRRSDTLRRHTGQIALPGGRLDPGETAWQAALREAREEVGLDPGFVSLAGLSTPYLTRTGYVVTPVVGFVAQGFTLAANPDEVADIFETPFGFLMDPANHEEHERPGPDGALRRFYGITHEDRFIWGVTAGILRALYARLYGASLG